MQQLVHLAWQSPFQGQRVDSVRDDGRLRQMQQHDALVIGGRTEAEVDQAWPQKCSVQFPKPDSSAFPGRHEVSLFCSVQP